MARSGGLTRTRAGGSTPPRRHHPGPCGPGTEEPYALNAVLRTSPPVHPRAGGSHAGESRHLDVRALARYPRPEPAAVVNRTAGNSKQAGVFDASAAIMGVLQFPPLGFASAHRVLFEHRCQVLELV